MKRAFLQSIIITALIFLGCSQPKGISVLLDKDEHISLQTGQNLSIKLKANPTTGYEWSLLSSDKDGVLNQLGNPTYMPGEGAKSGMVGAGGIQIYRFTASKEGKVVLVFQYARPWEESVEPVKRFVLQVTVSD